VCVCTRIAMRVCLTVALVAVLLLPSSSSSSSSPYPLPLLLRALCYAASNANETAVTAIAGRIRHQQPGVSAASPLASADAVGDGGETPLHCALHAWHRSLLSVRGGDAEAAAYHGRWRHMMQTLVAAGVPRTAGCPLYYAGMLART
jgi:hypothetical protein